MHHGFTTLIHYGIATLHMRDYMGRWVGTSSVTSVESLRDSQNTIEDGHAAEIKVVAADAVLSGSVQDSTSAPPWSRGPFSSWAVAVMRRWWLLNGWPVL